MHYVQSRGPVAAPVSLVSLDASPFPYGGRAIPPVLKLIDLHPVVHRGVMIVSFVYEGKKNVSAKNNHAANFRVVGNFTLPIRCSLGPTKVPRYAILLLGQGPLS